MSQKISEQMYELVRKGNYSVSHFYSLFVDEFFLGINSSTYKSFHINFTAQPILISLQAS